ncbi:hypothetical protein ACN47E_008899 [Coniothyrium glycines]
MLYSKSIPALILGLASMATAAPTLETRTSLPEVIPGPGLPSLESLGLTSEALYAMGKPESSPLGDDMSTMVEPRCGDSYGEVNAAIACYNYLRNLGQTPCTVGQGLRSQIMCRAGNIRIEGFGIGQSSWCEHVAHAVLWTIDHCTRNGYDTAGYEAAYGNGNLLIGTQAG